MLFWYPSTHEKSFKSGKLRRKEFWLDMSMKLTIFVSATGWNEESVILITSCWLSIEAQTGEISGGHGNALFVLADQKPISRLLYVKLSKNHFSLMYFCSPEPHSQYIREKLLIIIPEFRLVVKINCRQNSNCSLNVWKYTLFGLIPIGFEFLKLCNPPNMPKN